MSELYGLPERWEWKKLVDISEKIFAGGDKPENVSETKTDELNIPIYANAVKNNGLYGYCDVYKVDEECITISARGTIGFTVVRNEKFLPIVRLIVVIPKKSYLSKLLKYYLDYEIVGNTGSSIPQLTVPTVKKLDIPRPPLQEQKRIVSKLDTLFEKIDKAIALHQKNMDEATAFMGSVLNDVFGELEEKYKKILWNNVLTIKNGKHYKDVVDDNGKYPIYGSGGIMKYANQYICNEDTVIIGRKGTINKPIFVKEKFWNIDTAFGIEADRNILLPLFLFYFTQQFNFLDLNKSTTLPSLAKTNLLKIDMVIPPLNIQQKTVTYLDSISQKIETLKQVQKEKMQSLVVLKASILDQAFKGEL